MKKLLLILTGGTICSRANEAGHNFSDQAKAAPRLIETFQAGDSPARGAEFDTLALLDILSENMTVPRWNTLLDGLRGVDFGAYQGVLIAHGTDTLAYTASLLSLVLAGVGVPVVLISSDYSLDDPRNNGTENFRRGVELIAAGLTPGVYAVYRNSDGVTYCHRGAHLRQCGDYTNDFFSRDMVPVSAAPLGGGAAGEPLLYKMAPLTDSVLFLRPYVGIRYDRYSLEGVQAVVHGLYHARTACVEATAADPGYSARSALSLLDRCRERGIPFYIQPCRAEDFAYSSTAYLFDHGARGLYGMTPEMAYVKVLVSLSLPAEERAAFLARDIAGEFCYE